MNLLEEETLVCMICGLRSNQLVNHVKRIHGLSTQEYYEKFPGSKLSKLTKDQIEKMTITRNKNDTKNKRLKIERANRAREFSDVDPLKCRMCEYVSLFSLTSHILHKHKTKVSEYRKMYPDDLIQRISLSQIEEQRKTSKQKLKDPEIRKKFLEWRSFPSEIKHWTRKGYTEEEAKEKVAEFQRSQSLRGNNEKTRTLRSRKYSGDNNPMSLKSIADRNDVSIREASKMTPCHGRSGDLHPMFGKKHSEEAIRKIGSHINTTRKSKIEHDMSDFIISKYGGLKNENVFGWCCDYVNHDKKIIVEFFGDFWHHNPKKYPKNWTNPFTKRTSEYVYARDNKKIEELKSLGYKVIVIWETDWRTNREEEVQKITNAFDSI